MSDLPPEEEDFLNAVFGDEPDDGDLGVVSLALKSDFSPWHHPIKQVVRKLQWEALAAKMIGERLPERRARLRYFTLPGADLLDIRSLAGALEEYGTQIDYFGFDSGYEQLERSDREGTYFAAESALRQSGRVSEDAVVVSDHLEDIAVEGSQAANRLQQKGFFDILNIDACSHLGYSPEGRAKSLFDAVQRLLLHQLKHEEPWLLFLTTRANSEHLSGPPADALQRAVSDNLKAHPEAFGSELAECLGLDLTHVEEQVEQLWSGEGEPFLRLFSVGFGKYLLQYFLSQANLKADVELVSLYSYKVKASVADMLSFAFRITPRGLFALPPTAGPIQIASELEAPQAVRLAKRVKRIWDLDAALDSEAELKAEIVKSCSDLLSSASYDIAAWRKWVRSHPVRPLTLDGEPAAV